jgi:hypothetical protein
VPAADHAVGVGGERPVMDPEVGVSLPIRRYSTGGILMEGRRSRGHRAESSRDGGIRVTQLRNTCSMTGPTTASLELSGRFRVTTMSCGCASRAPKIHKGARI